MTGLGDNGRERDDEPFGEEQWDDTHDEHEELALAEDDGPLPWLEPDDYEEEPEGSGLGRLLLTFLIGLLAIGAILYGLWYMSNRPDPALVADGSTIEAPEGPMKERPEDPGGKTFEGTGDVAPGVGEGQTREGRLATDGAGAPALAATSGTGASADAANGRDQAASAAAPRPSVDAAGSRAAQASASGGVGVQVGAYSSREAAERGWTQLTRQTDALQGVRYRIMEGQIESGTVYRLQAVAGSASAASTLCGKLKGQGIPCQVKN